MTKHSAVTLFPRQLLSFGITLVACTAGCTGTSTWNKRLTSDRIEIAPAAPAVRPVDPDPVQPDRPQSAVIAAAYDNWQPPSLNLPEPPTASESTREPSSSSDAFTSTAAESLTAPSGSLSFAKLLQESDPCGDLDSYPMGMPVLTDDAADLASLEALAISTHPELQAARSLVEQARGQAYQAGLPYNPVLQYQSDEIGNEDSSGLHSVTLSQRFVTANKLGIARQGQLQTVQRRLAQFELARLRLLTKVRAAYAEMLIAQNREVIAKSIADLASRSAATVKSLLDAQEVSRIAFLQARVEARRADLAHRNALATLDQKRRALAATVGIPELPSMLVDGQLPEQLDPAPWQTLSDEIATLSPQMSAAAAQLQRARWALQLACAQVTPDVTGQLGVGYDAFSNDTYATVGVSLPIPIRNRNEGNIRAARASIAAASATIDNTELQLQRALADAVGRYEVARTTYTQLHNEVGPDAEEAFELARKAFGSGEADFLQVLTAQRTWFDTRLAAINALQEAQVADAEIRGALTLSVPK